ncbi:hypothetical protein ABW19_dt0209704 [Dactylella cylindrospora]|nr:hypothetical protein ABW19_dt0209704 [Dactylella cylindrospora]
MAPPTRLTISISIAKIDSIIVACGGGELPLPIAVPLLNKFHGIDRHYHDTKAPSRCLLETLLGVPSQTHKPLVQENHFGIESLGSDSTVVEHGNRLVPPHIIR